ncbi:hypothetical protein LSAT2_022741, partial [Lamellibrachia satsuma]
MVGLRHTRGIHYRRLVRGRPSPLKAVDGLATPQHRQTSLGKHRILSVRGSYRLDWKRVLPFAVLTAREIWQRLSAREQRLSAREQRLSSREQRRGAREQILSAREQILIVREQRPSAREQKRGAREQILSAREQRLSAREQIRGARE